MLELILATSKPAALPTLTNYALYMGGAGTNTLQSTLKYGFVSDTYGAGTSISTNFQYGAGAGNATQGIFAGVLVPTTQGVRYTYATDVVAALTALASGRARVAASSNATFALFSGGYNAGPLTNVDKYTHSTNTAASVSNLAGMRYSASAAGESTKSCVVGGFDNSGWLKSLEEIVYASNVQSTSTAMTSTGRYLMASFSDKNVGIYAGGETGSTTFFGNTDEYTFSSKVWTARTALSPARSHLAGAANTDTGVFAGNSASGSAVLFMNKYAFASKTYSTGTDLPSTRDSPGATSSNPGNF